MNAFIVSHRKEIGNTELNKTNINFNILKKELDHFPQIMIVCF